MVNSLLSTMVCYLLFCIFYHDLTKNVCCCCCCYVMNDVCFDMNNLCERYQTISYFLIIFFFFSLSLLLCRKIQPRSSLFIKNIRTFLANFCLWIMIHDFYYWKTESTWFFFSLGRNVYQITHFLKETWNAKSLLASYWNLCLQYQSWTHTHQQQQNFSP